MCVACRLARVEANKDYAEEEGTSGAACLQSLRPKFPKLLSIDGEFLAEIMLMV